MPFVFVIIWATGFLVARYGMSHSPPMKFLAVRYGLSVVCSGIWALASRAVWPRGHWRWIHLCVTGILMNAIYLGGVWTAVKLGMGAGLTSLLVGLQPVLTAIWLSCRGGCVSRAQWVGLSLGLLGLLLVVWAKLGFGEIRPASLACAVISLLSITVGTLYQKRFVVPCDVRTAGFIQLLAAFVVTTPLALLEAEPMRWIDIAGGLNSELAMAMAWSVLGLTLGGSSLLYLLIQRGAATSVTSLLYLVPPTTAVTAWMFFDEPITSLTAVGMTITAIGVGIVMRK